MFTKSKKFRMAIIGILSLFLLMACTPKQVVLTPEQEPERAYYESKAMFNQAQKEFATKLQKYNMYCEKAEYKDACSKIDPLILKADKALDVWETIIEARGPSTSAENDYREQLKALKTKMLLELPNYVWD